MSDEIDLHLFFQALRRRWWVIAICVVAAVAAAFAISVAQPKHYEAEATLTAQSPRYQWRFDVGIQSIIDTRRDYQREYLAIAGSNDIAVRAAELLSTTEQLADLTPDAIRSTVSVRTGDANTLLVTATASDPQRATQLANAYAQAFVELARSLSGASSDLANYRAELDIASQKLAQAEQILANTRQATGFLLVSGTDPNSLELQNPALRQLDLKTQRLAMASNDLDGVRTLLGQLEATPPGADLTQLPWELLGGPTLSQRGVVSPAWALQNLDNPPELLAALRIEEAALSAGTDQLLQETEDLRRQVAEDWRNYSTATRNYGLVRDVYNLVSRKVSEAEIQERIDPAQLTLVSAALEPAKPTQTRQVALYLVASVIGLILGVIIALWLGLKDSRKPQPQAATLP